ncbi:DUF6880 family protein [Stella sp.]|uniref:DUF6880 family protein n=1 Tax=Stella sp. TaxID=2912054 RepID=UPI0035B0C1F9
MAGRRALVVGELAALGAERLAGILIERAAGDAVLERRLRMLAAVCDPQRLAGDVVRRIQQMARARSPMDAEQARVAAREVADLHRAIVDDLAPARPAAAAECLWQLVDAAPALLARAEFGGDRLDAAVAAAVADLGRLTAAQADLDPVALARRVSAALNADGTPATDGLLAAMAEALGTAGRAAMRREAQAALSRLPAGDADWQNRGKRLALVSRLLQLADLDGDVDAFAAAVAAGGLPQLHSAEVARRLLAAGRAAEGLDWIDRHPPRIGADAAVDLRLELLDALGRRAEAQTLRRTHFERTCSARHLRTYLQALPDFEDFAEEQRALDHVMAVRDPAAALDFLVAWPDLGRAARLAADRLDAFDLARTGPMLRAAEALEARYPEAAVRLRRRAVALVLAHGASAAYADAALALVDAGRVAGRVAGGLEPHAAFVAGLRREYGRKWRFWQLHDAAG